MATTTPQIATTGNEEEVLDTTNTESDDDPDPGNEQLYCFWERAYEDCWETPNISLDEFRERFWDDDSREIFTEDEFTEFWCRGLYVEAPDDHVELDDLELNSVPFDSLYLPNRKPDRYILCDSLDYEECTAKELRSFINQRGLADPFPQGLTLKFYYIRVLAKADQTPHFELMDLPPEMRLHVYRQLLSLPEDACPCCTSCEASVLRTSRAVNQEATGILYDNLISCGVSVTQDPTTKIHKSARVHTELLNCAAAGGHNSYFNIPNGIDAYPAFFRRIKRLKVSFGHTIDGDGAVNWSGYYPLNHFLWTLTSFLMEGHSLKQLDIVAYLDQKVEDVAAGRIVYPLMNLRNIEKVTITGLPDNVCKKLKATLRGTHASKVNTMRYWKLLEEETSAQKALLRMSNQLAYCECGACEYPDCCSTLVMRMASVEEARMEGCMSSSLEENLRARLGRLSKSLVELDTADMEDKIKAVKDKRMARLAQDAKTANANYLGAVADKWNHKYGCEEEEEDAMHAGGIHDWSDDEAKENETRNIIAAVTEASSEL